MQRSSYPKVRPATDAVEMPDGVHIFVNMPGVRDDELLLSLEGQKLHVEACTHCPLPVGEHRSVRNLEFGNVEYELNVLLEAAPSAPVQTSLDHGVLSVFLPSSPEAVSRPRFL